MAKVVIQCNAQDAIKPAPCESAGAACIAGLDMAEQCRAKRVQARYERAAGTCCLRGYYKLRVSPSSKPNGKSLPLESAVGARTLLAEGHGYHQPVRISA